MSLCRGHQSLSTGMTDNFLKRHTFTKIKKLKNKKVTKEQSFDLIFEELILVFFF